jgi:hypothetical protein
LEDGEEVLVGHWEVSHVWNYAMEAFARVETFGFGAYVYGETCGWDLVKKYLKGKCGALKPKIYSVAPQVGFECHRQKGRN